MALSFSLTYHNDVVQEDIPALDPAVKMRIKQDIEKKLTTYPQLYGKPLRGSLKNRFKLRIGDYRVIYTLSSKTVKILAIKHRSVVYKIAGERNA